MMAALATPGAAAADRGYEIVTPPGKTSGIASYNPGYQVGTTTDGNHVFFYSQQPIVPTAPDSPWLYRADRGAQGWTLTEPLPRPVQDNSDIRMVNFDDETLSMLTLTSSGYHPLDLDFKGFGGADLYLFDATGALAEWPSRGEINNDVSISVLPRASTTDGRHVVFTAVSDVGDEPALVPEAIGMTNFPEELYEYADGDLRLVQLDGAGDRLTDGTTYLGSPASSFNALSRDGSHLYFTATNENAPTISARDGLYLSVDGGAPLPIPASPAGANARSIFAGATPDGSQVFFHTPDGLVPDDTDGGMDLYRYTVATQTLTRVSAGASPAGTVPLLVWPSDDGRRVYFTATGQLVPGQGTADTPKTFLWDDGELRFVADAGLIDSGQDFESSPACSNARATPDGEHLLAATTVPLLGVDHDTARDVYLFSAATGELKLLSTSAADAQGANDADIHAAQPWFRDRCSPYNRITHPMSDDGRHVFFQTAEALEPRDADGKEDVYEWDADSGSARLLTAGTASSQYAGDPNVGNSYFLDATPDGKNVLVATQDRLVPEDRDEMTDIYDIREGGGFPHAEASKSCSDSDCQGAPGALPAMGTPGSSTRAEDRTVPQQRKPTVRARLRLGAVSARALRRFAETGRLTLTVRTTVAGRITVRGRAVIRSARPLVASGSRRASRAGVLRIRVRMSPSGRRVLRQRGRLRVVLTASEGGARTSKALTVRAEVAR